MSTNFLFIAVVTEEVTELMIQATQTNLWYNTTNCTVVCVNGGVCPPDPTKGMGLNYASFMFYEKAWYQRVECPDSHCTFCDYERTPLAFFLRKTPSFGS